MGLDVYVYRYEDYEATIKLESEHERQTNLVWEQAGGCGVEYNDMTDEDKTKARAETDAISTQLGLGEYGEDTERKVKLEIDSAQYPEHYFKIGYFRSSYNSSGFNQVVSNMTDGGGLGKIFNADDEHIIKPDWTQSKKNAISLLAELNAAIEQNGSYRVMDITISHKVKASSSEEALKVFLGEKRRHGKENELRSYGCMAGDFFLKGINIVAMIPGRRWNSDCMFYVYESDLSWYIQGLEIVIETIDYVIGQDDIDKYYLHWSG